jgi:hypothetical protein
MKYTGLHGNNQVSQNAPAWRRPMYYSLLKVTPLATCKRLASHQGLEQWLKLQILGICDTISPRDEFEQQWMTAAPQKRGGREAP